MKMLTAEIIKKLTANPLYSGESKTIAPVLVKFFCPWNQWTWYALEGSCDEEGWLFFGLVIGQETELGYFRLNELESVRGRFGLKIERDIHFSGMEVDKTTNTVRKAVQS